VGELSEQSEAAGDLVDTEQARQHVRRSLAVEIQ